MTENSLKKRLVCVGVALLLCGCGKGAPAPSEIPEGRTPVAIMYTNDLTSFEALVEDVYPDIDLRVERNVEATIDGESERRLKSGHGTDLVFTTMPLDSVSEYVVDLSAEEYVSKYQAGIMNSLKAGGEIRFIPLPGQYSGYIYNATFAREAGITEPPESNGELLAMLDAISAKGLGKSEDGVMYAMESSDLVTASTYFLGTQIPDFLGVSEGIKWRQSLTDKTGSFADGMSHCIDVTSAMAERGYQDPAMIAAVNRNVTPVYERMIDGTLAMTYSTVDFLEKLNEDSDKYEYGMLPFLSDKGNHAWTIVMPDAYLGINSALLEPGSEAKLDAAGRVMSLLSTPEGQRAFIEDIGEAQSYLTAPVNGANIPEGLAECIENGYVYNLQFPPKLLLYFGKQMLSVLNGEAEIADALAKVDDYFINGDDDVEYDQTLVGVMADDLIYENYNVRREETAIGNLVSDAVREATGADMSFVNGGSIRGSLYKGNVFGYDLDVVCPHENKLVILETDAQTIRLMLENGISRIIQDNGIPGGRFLNVSGLCYSFRAPSGDEPAELLDVTLPDGSPLDEKAKYTLALTSYMAGANGYLDNNGDGFTMINVFSDTAPLAEGVRLVREAEYTCAGALQAYFANHGGEAITAKVEGRIKVVEGGE